MVANNGKTPQSDPTPLIAVSNGGNPPATGGAVVTPPVVAPGTFTNQAIFTKR
jgi:filamentous hemagglutinin